MSFSNRTKIIIIDAFGIALINDTFLLQQVLIITHLQNKVKLISHYTDFYIYAIINNFY